MNNREFSEKLEKRTKDFAISVFKMSLNLPKNIEFNVLRNQIVKSATSIGANYREANRARSKADFRNKIKICEGEANETLYWIELIEELQGLNSHNELKSECIELLSIFSSISKKLVN